LFPWVHLEIEAGTGWQVRWVGAIPDLESAETEARQLMKCSPGDYFVYSQTSGSDLWVSPENGSGDVQEGKKS
jgi:hypothetical protein